jgi:hypothetical protein
MREKTVLELQNRVKKLEKQVVNLTLEAMQTRDFMIGLHAVVAGIPGYDEALGKLDNKTNPNDNREQTEEEIEN